MKLHYGIFAVIWFRVWNYGWQMRMVQTLIE